MRNKTDGIPDLRG
jgi:hypothetical protein